MTRYDQKNENRFWRRHDLRLPNFFEFLEREMRITMGNAYAEST